MTVSRSVTVCPASLNGFKFLGFLLETKKVKSRGLQKTRGGLLSPGCFGTGKIRESQVEFVWRRI